MPIFLSPKPPTTHAIPIVANAAQKPALYPSINAAGLCRSVFFELFVTEAEMTVMIVSPMLDPNCATVLKTAPARAWVVVGKTSETTRRPTVKSISQEIGRKIWAGKAANQYGQWTLMMAMRSGESALMISEPRTR